MTHDVFISYSSKDKPAAEAACATLEAQGISCWIAPRDILPGAEWGPSIVKAIHDARIFVLLLSSHANASPQISREVERAVNRAIPVIPVRLEDVAPAESLEYFINTPHWLDAFKPPLEQHLTYLATVVRTLLDGGTAATQAGASPPPAPPAPVPPAPRPAHRPRWLILAGAGAAAIALAAGAAVWLAIFQTPPGPTVDPQCLVEAPSLSNAGNCQALLNQNPVWQGCAAAYAQADMDKLAGRAQSMIASGQTGVDLYEASPEFKAYGTISHYWEMFAQCVQDGHVKFDDLSGGVPFPDAYWSRTRPLRRAIGANWKGANQPLPDFMSNFQALCEQYKAARNKARPGDGDSLDCSL